MYHPTSVDPGFGPGQVPRVHPVDGGLDVRSIQTMMSRASSSSTVDREDQPQPTTGREVTSVCQSSFGRWVGSRNDVAADSTRKAGLGIRSYALRRR